MIQTSCSGSRSRQTQPKSKSDGKNDLFGFDDTTFHQEENSAGGRSTYKIQYFGFDDMSDGDGADDDSGYQERRKAKKAPASKITSSGTPEETPADDTPHPFERPESRDRPVAKERKKNSERSDIKRRAG